MNDDYYCEFKKECIKDNCDCMYEEWHIMSEQNVILCNKINKAIEQIQIDKNCIDEDDVMQDTLDDLLDILKGEEDE